MYELKSVLAYRRVLVVVDDQNLESEGLSFNSSGELKIFLLSYAHDPGEKSILLHFTILVR